MMAETEMWHINTELAVITTKSGLSSCLVCNLGLAS